MNGKAGRNDPCPCGSGKKYKHCCWNKRLPLSKRKFKASIISSGSQQKSNESPNLMERTFGNAIRKATDDGLPPLPPEEGEKPEEKKTPEEGKTETQGENEETLEENL